MNALIGTQGLIRLIMRRDRWAILVWIAVSALVCVAFAAGYKALYPTAAERARYFAGTAQNTTLVALLGRAYSMSLGGLVTQRLGLVFLVGGLVSLLLVIRHTRAEEESGRAELAVSTAVGRHSSLAAALIVVLTANLALALLATLGEAALGLPIRGSLAFGLSLAAVGWQFAAVAAVTAQVAEGAGTARGIGICVLGIAYLLRATGDAASVQSGVRWLAWVSPLEWAERTRPYAGERWWVHLITVAFVAVLVMVAALLSAHRDLAGGTRPPREGRATASRGLGSTFGLSFRLQSSLLAGWAAGLAVAGAVLGGVAKSATNALEASRGAGFHDLVQRLGGHTGLSDAYLTAVMGFLALAAAGYAIQATLRLRTEELAGRAEFVLSTAARRWQLVNSHVVFALFGPVLLLAAAGLGAGLTYGVSGNDVGHQVPRVLASALVQVPAVWVLAGVALALFGAAPRFTGLSWAALAACLLVGQLGAALKLNQAVLDVSPFTHVPKILGGRVTAVPLAVLTAVVFALALAGLGRFRLRDIGTG